MSKGLGLLGMAMLVAGVVLGFRSMSAAGGHCGSVFDPAAGITPMACDGRLDSSGRIVAGLVVLGIVAVAGAVLLARRRERQLSRQDPGRVRWR